MATTPKSVIIALATEPVGILRATGKSYSFSYFKEYEESSDAIPISLSYPLKKGALEYSFAGDLPPYFNHLLPEGWLKEIAETSHLPMDTALEKLATLCRHNLGAVEVYGPLDISPSDYSSAVEYVKNTNTKKEKPLELLSTSTASNSYPSWYHCVRCHQKLPKKGYNRNFHDDCAEQFFGVKNTPYLNVSNNTLIDIAKQQLDRKESLTGVQPKFSVIFAKDRNSLIDSSFIVKPEPTLDRGVDGIQYKYSTIAELAAMHFIELLELGAAETALLYLNDNQPALISKRFDRSKKRKLHTEDAAQALSIRDKYKGSHEKLAGLLKKITNKSIREGSLKRLLNITLLNFIIGNSDGHLKNFSIIHSFSVQHSYELSPFYDVLPTRIFSKKDTDQLALTIDGKRSKLTANHFTKMVIKFGLKANLVGEYVDEIEANLDSFYEPFELFGVPDSVIESLKEYCEAQISLFR